ncbi:MAG: hypothetical protein ACRDM0_27195, partial [Thermoleophilaceae bacterium]
FGVTGIATGVFALLMRRGAGFPRRLADLGALSGVLLVLIYLARLLVFDPNNPLVAGPAALEGLVVNPAFYVWLGLHLRR